MKVLIVEDEPRFREVLVRAVREMGFTAAAARTAEEALRAMEAAAHQIALLDLNLPGMGGMDLLAALRQRWPGVQAVILTGFGDLAAARRAIHLDVADFLTKPCPLGEIEEALERARRRLTAPPRHADSLKWNDRPGFIPHAEFAHHAIAAEPGAVATMDEVERQHILASLDRHAGNRTAAAAELGISVRKLYYRLARYHERG